jgi:hypothetical protein
MGAGIDKFGMPFALAAITLSAAYAGATGGLEGLVDFAGSMIGGAYGTVVGKAVVSTFTTPSPTISTGTGESYGKDIDTQRRRIVNMMGMLDEARAERGLLGQIETQRLIVRYNTDPSPLALARQVRIAVLEHSGPEAQAVRRYKALKSVLSFIHSMLSQEEHNLGEDLQWEMWDYMTSEDGATKHIEERENIYVPRKQKMLLDIWGDLIEQFCN